MTPLVHAIFELDRQAGRAVRAATARHPAATRLGATASAVLGPAFRLVVAALVISRSGRRAGMEALASGAAAATAARALRDALGRPRPGPRAEGGLPSRHAAAAVAIACAVAHHHRGLGGVLAVAAAAGLAGRVVSREHDPADIVSGAAVGAGAQMIVAGVARAAGGAP